MHFFATTIFPPSTNFPPSIFHPQNLAWNCFPGPAFRARPFVRAGALARKGRRETGAQGETYNVIIVVIHYQTIGQRKTRRIPFRDRSHRRSWLERVFMLTFLERMASKTSSLRKRRPCCCHGVCIGFLRPEAQSQEIEIEHEIMK